MKLHQQPAARYLFLWFIIFYLVAFLSSRFYFFSLGLFPIALYELKRTEGIKNTRPISFLVSILLLFQFLHSSQIFLFPFSVTPILNLFPLTLPPSIDPVVFVSVILLLLFSLLLLRYTWGSITKFLSIVLLFGGLIQAYLFWPQIQSIFQTPQGQQFLEGQQQRLQDNLLNRLEKEMLSP